MLHRFDWVGVAFICAAALAGGCATNPATGQTQLSFIGTEEEIALGQQEAKKVEQSIGLYDDDRVKAYVNELAVPMARASERPQLPWTFEVVDDASVNAFALPGGPIYVTRGMLAYVNSSAELATVLGHEIGHVTARHSVNQLSKATLAQLGLGLGGALSETVARFGSVLGAGLQVLLLKYSRDAEREADTLGFRYALEQGWDVREMETLFETLRRVSEAGGGGSLPDWLSTHPDPEERARTVEQRLGQVDVSTLKTGRERYFQVVDQLVFGPDPRVGFFRDDTFLHPELALSVAFPPGWQRQNTPAAAMAVSPEQDAAFVLASTAETSPDAALTKFAQEAGVEAAAVSSPVPVKGSTAARFTLADEGTRLAGVVAFFPWNGKVLQLLGYSLADRAAAVEPVFARTMGSVARVTDREVLDAQPARIQVVQLDEPTTPAQLAARSTEGVGAEELARLNGVDPGASVPAGPAKVVSGGLPELFQK